QPEGHMASHIERTRFAQGHPVSGSVRGAVRIVMRAVSFALLIATIATFSAAQARVRVIDFEDRPVGARIDADYSARGVIFFNAYLDSDPHAHSGTKVLRRISPSEEVFEAASRAFSAFSRIICKRGRIPRTDARVITGIIVMG